MTASPAWSTDTSLSLSRVCSALKARSVELLQRALKEEKVDTLSTCEFSSGTLVEIALQQTATQQGEESGYEMAAALLNNGAQLNIRLNSGYTPATALLAQRLGDHRLLRFLLEHGANLKEPVFPPPAGGSDPFHDMSKATLLMLAARSDSLDLAFQKKNVLSADDAFSNYASKRAFFTALIAASDLDAQDAYGRSVLHHSVLENCEDLTVVLVQTGAKRAQTDLAGQAPLDYALALGRQSLVHALEQQVLPPEAAPPAAASASPVVSPGIPQQKEGAETTSTAGDIINNTVPPPTVPSATTETPQPAEATIVEPVTTESNRVEVKQAATESEVSPPTTAPATTTTTIPALTHTSPPAPTYTFKDGADAANRGNFKEARQIWENLAPTGDSNAIYSLGRIYARGDGVSRDFSKARHYFEDAAKLKHPGALYGLGLMYLRGDGVAKNKTLGTQYIERAAAMGHKPAQDMLLNISE